MGEWAKAAFKRLQEREGKSHDENQQRALDRQQILATAPDLWEQLTDGILEEVSDFESMRPDILKAQDERQTDLPRLSVTTPVRTLFLSFNRGIPKISYHVSQPQGYSLEALQIVKGDFTFRVGPVGVYLDRAGAQTAIPVAVRYLLDNLEL